MIQPSTFNSNAVEASQLTNTTVIQSESNINSIIIESNQQNDKSSKWAKKLIMTFFY